MNEATWVVLVWSAVRGEWEVVMRDLDREAAKAYVAQLQRAGCLAERQLSK